MRRALTLALLAAACGGTAATTTAIEAPTTTASTTTTLPTETITGSIELQEGMLSPRDNCSGQGGYDDLTEGAQVVVKDGDGNVIGTGRLDAGRSVEAIAGTMWFCTFDFSVEVPADRPFYVIEVSHRGELTYSLADMQENDWTLSLTLD